MSYVRRDWGGLQSHHVTVCLEEQLIKMAFLKKDSRTYQKVELRFADYSQGNLDFYLQLYGCPPLIVQQIKSLVAPYIQSDISAETDRVGAPSGCIIRSSYQP